MRRAGRDGRPFDVALAGELAGFAPGRPIGERVRQRWQEFGQIDVPVVTVYGSYDVPARAHSFAGF